MLCKVSSIIMTVAIDAHYLPLVDFYNLALLASRSTRWVRLRFVLHNTDHCFTFAVILALFLLAVPLASCSGRSVRLCFVLCNAGWGMMTVAINALYMPFVDFYAPALLASWFFLRLLRPDMLAHQTMTNPSGFAPSGTVVVSHEVKKWIRTFW